MHIKIPFVYAGTTQHCLCSCRYVKYDPNGKEPLGLSQYNTYHEKDGVLLGVPGDAGEHAEYFFVEGWGWVESF